MGNKRIPTPIDQVLDGRIAQTHVKIDALFGQRRPHPGEKSGHILHLLCHQGPLGTVCLQQGSGHVCLWPGYHLHHDTAKHGYSSVVKESIGELTCALLSSLMRLCMRVMDVQFTA